MSNPNIIITSLGIRGKIGELTPNMVLKYAEAYGTLIGKGKNVLLARDTRLSSRMFRNEIINGLLSVGINIYNLGVVPVPCLLFNMRRNNIHGGIMITGSHIPEDWNGIKFVDGKTKTFITSDFLNKIKKIYESKNFKYVDYKNIGSIQKIEGLTGYIHSILDNIDISLIKKKKYKVVLDPVAGCGLTVTPQLFIKMRCKTQIINDSLNSEYPYFPRKIEPKPENLNELSKAVEKSKADIGFAHDIDADRVAIALNKSGKILNEDIVLALIVKDYLENHENCTLVVNVASSRIFQDLAKKFDANYEEVKVGEVYVSTRLNQILNNYSNINVIGGEGSCGGVILPQLNNTRDGPLACAKILEIMAKNDLSISKLVKQLPTKYYMIKERIRYSQDKYKKIINTLKEEYFNYEINEIDGLKFYNKHSWFLIRKSGTEPIIRIYVESEKKNRTKKLSDEIMELINNITKEKSTKEE
ncbi:MAG: hypothetical protein GF329_16530 [Candidatus Lokiarchaeota archaeon]|nr:hypothetical protein [Candidatus Lokiarchaeota archaeon]